MVEDFEYDILKLCPEECAILMENFMEKDVFESITQMEHNKASIPDGFPTEFY
jgi:hypothetical protein